MSNIKVSVCISVHNTEKYLPRCLDSLLVQTLDEIEMILVNNGSTDDSELIMNKYQKENPDRCIRIFSQEDRGLAQGRQTGVDNARGEFIAFLDADDYVKPTTYEELYNAAIENGVDIVEMDTIREDSIISSPYTGVMECEEVLKRYLEYANIPTMLWLRIYRKELFHKPVLPQLYTNNEDNFALPCLLYSAKKIFYLHKPLHVYSTDNENAVMTVFEKKDKGKRYYENRKKTLFVVGHVENYIGKKVLMQKYAREFLQFKYRVITSFFFSDMIDVSYKMRMRDVCSTFEDETEKSILDFIKKNARRDCLTNKLVSVLGLKKVYVVYHVKRMMRR